MGVNATPVGKTEYIVKNQTPKRLSISGRGPALFLAPLERREIAETVKKDYDFGPWEAAGGLAIEKVKAKELELGWVPSAALTIAIVFGIVGAVLSDELPKAYPWYWTVGTPVLVVVFLAGVIVYVMRRQPSGWGQRILQYLYQWGSLLLTLVVGVGLPGALVYYFGGIGKLVAQWPDSSLALLGRGLQLSFITVAALLPGLLFYLFDRLRLGTLRARFYRQVFRLDPYINTMDDVKTKYGHEIEEVYGTEEEGGGSRLLSGSRWPVLLATAVFVLGWVFTLLPVEGDVKVEKPGDLLLMLRPWPDAMAFAFLGAYFYSVNNALRRYVRGDLRPKAYSSMTVRVIIVVILAWVLEVLFQGEGKVYLQVVAFFAGVFPETALMLIGEFLKSRHVGYNPYTEEQPLTKLEGVELYDRARLLDEGVTNIQSLAHCELVDLLLQTRVPAPRLVDWVDQAVLYLHVNKESRRDKLRDMGVRTATDLEEVFNSEPGLFDPEMPAVVASLWNDEWMPYLRYWHRSQQYVETVHSPDQLFVSAGQP